MFPCLTPGTGAVLQRKARVGLKHTRAQRQDPHPSPGWLEQPHREAPSLRCSRDLPTSLQPHRHRHSQPGGCCLTVLGLQKGRLYKLLFLQFVFGICNSFLKLNGKETEGLRVYFCSSLVHPTSTTLHMKNDCKTEGMISNVKAVEITPPAVEATSTEHLCQGGLSWACSVTLQSWNCSHTGSPGRKGGMGTMCGCCTASTQSEAKGKDKDKASTALGAAVQVFGSSPGQGVCGKEVSTPKRTEPATFLLPP